MASFQHLLERHACLDQGGGVELPLDDVDGVERPGEDDVEIVEGDLPAGQRCEGLLAGVGTGLPEDRLA